MVKHLWVVATGTFFASFAITCTRLLNQKDCWGKWCSQ